MIYINFGLNNDFKAAVCLITIAISIKTGSPSGRGSGDGASETGPAEGQAIGRVWAQQPAYGRCILPSALIRKALMTLE